MKLGYRLYIYVGYCLNFDQATHVSLMMVANKVLGKLKIMANT